MQRGREQSVRVLEQPDLCLDLIFCCSLVLQVSRLLDEQWDNFEASPVKRSKGVSDYGCAWESGWVGTGWSLYLVDQHGPVDGVRQARRREGGVDVDAVVDQAARAPRAIANEAMRGEVVLPGLGRGAEVHVAVAQLVPRRDGGNAADAHSRPRRGRLVGEDAVRRARVVEPSRVRVHRSADAHQQVVQYAKVVLVCGVRTLA